MEEYYMNYDMSVDVFHFQMDTIQHEQTLNESLLKLRFDKNKKSINTIKPPNVWFVMASPPINRLIMVKVWERITKPTEAKIAPGIEYFNFKWWLGKNW